MWADIKFEKIILDRDRLGMQLRERPHYIPQQECHINQQPPLISGPDRFGGEGKKGLEDRVGVARICGRNVGAANLDRRQHFCGRIITVYNVYVV